MSILQRVVQQSGSNKSGWMCHVDHEDGTYLVGNFAHPFVVPFARISRSASDNHFRVFTKSHFLHLVVVHPSGFFVQIVLARSVDDARRIDSRSVRQVASVCQIQSHELIARVQYGKKHRCISLCSRVRLYVGPFSTKDFLHPFNGKLFALVYHFASSVISFSGISFGIFIGKARAHRLHDFIAYEVFRSNQFDAFQLALMFFLDDVEN